MSVFFLTALSCWFESGMRRSDAVWHCLESSIWPLPPGPLPPIWPLPPIPLSTRHFEQSQLVRSPLAVRSKQSTLLQSPLMHLPYLIFIILAEVFSENL